jgi:hypothetical protein
MTGDFEARANVSVALGSLRRFAQCVDAYKQRALPRPQIVKLFSALIGAGSILYGSYSIITGNHQLLALMAIRTTVQWSGKRTQFGLGACRERLSTGLANHSSRASDKDPGFFISLINRITK